MPLVSSFGVREGRAPFLGASLAAAMIGIAAPLAAQPPPDASPAARPAEDGETPRVLVVRSTVDDAARADELGLAVLELLRLRGWPVRRPAAAATPPSETDTLAAARDAYDQLRPDEARAILDALRLRLTRTGGAGLDEEGHQAFWLLDALVGQALGDDARTDRALRRARVAFPGLAPDPRLYPPGLRSRLEAVAAPEERALVEVETVEEALVWVDGRPLPPGERRLRLVPGRHFLRAAAGGFAPAGREATVTPGQATVIRLPLAPDDEARLRRAGPPGASLPDRTTDAAVRLDVGLLVLDVAPDPAAGNAPELARVATLTDRPTGRRGEVVLAPGAPPAPAAGRLVASLTADAGPTDGRSGGSDDDLLPWVVGGAAAVVSVVAVVLAVVLARQDGEQEPEGFRLRWEVP